MKIFLLTTWIILGGDVKEKYYNSLYECRNAMIEHLNTFPNGGSRCTMLIENIKDIL